MSFQSEREQRAKEYWWIGGEALERLRKQLAGPATELRVYPASNEKGQPSIWVQVYDGAEACGGEENSSHICPPICE